MIKIGSSDIDTIKIGSTDVDKVMLGGVEIYPNAVECIDLPSDSAAFIAEYTSSAEASATARDQYDYFPYGPRMWLSGYSVTTSQIDQQAAKGFTVNGPQYHGSSTPGHADQYPTHWEYAWDNYNMKSYFRLWPGNGVTWADDPTSYVIQMINLVLDDPKLNNAVCAWYGSPEEPMAEGYTITQQRLYMQRVYEAIEATDTKLRPYFVSERTDAGTYMAGNMQWQGGSMKQNYLIQSNAFDYSRNATTQPLQRRLIADWPLEYQMPAVAAYPTSYSGREKPVITTPSMYIDPDNATYNTQSWLENFCTHDICLGLLTGVHGVDLYSYDWINGNVAYQRDTYESVISKIVAAGIDKALLWGDVRSDVSQDSTSANKTFGYKQYSNAKSAPSITFKNIQHGTNRFLLLVNTDPGANHSDTDTISVTLTGTWGTGIKATDILTGDDMPLSGTTLTAVLKPRQCRFILLDPADGYCGGDEPQAPSIVGPDNETGYVNGTATFTVTASGGAPYTYQWKRNDANVGTNSPSYTTEALALDDDGDLIKVVVTNDTGSTQSSTATLTVTEQPSGIGIDGKYWTWDGI